MQGRVKYLFAVNIMFFVYSFMSVLGKLAARENEINLRFLILYSGSLMVMGVYALCWQQIIKKLPLMVAYANKAVIIIWGSLWGCLFFGETVTPGKLAGIVTVVIGVVLFATSECGDAV